MSSQQQTDTRTAQDRAQEKAEGRELAQDEMRELEAGDAPTQVDGWPSGPAKFLTYGIDDGESYGAGQTAKLGPPDLRRYADGSVSIGGVKVDNPEDYRGEPIPGGPTDPANRMRGDRRPEAAAAEEDTRSAETRAKDKADGRELAQEEMRELEAGDAPTNVDQWPSGPAKFLTYGIDDGESYGAGLTAKLGPPDLRRYADGSVSIGGVKLDNPEDYRGEPIPGGPTDHSTPG
jgi:hypothetical protein